MKKSISAVLIYLNLCVFLMSGCSTEKTEFSQEDIQKVKEAVTAYDVAEWIKRPIEYLTYSECEDESVFSIYFDVIFYNDDNEYFIVDYNGEKYLIFLYLYSNYGGNIMSSLTSVDKEYRENALYVSVTGEIINILDDTEQIQNCDYMPAPDDGELYCSWVKCIIKLEKDITSLIVNDIDYNVDRVYNKFDTGYICACNLWGVVDENLNIIVPIQYDANYLNKPLFKKYK